MTPTRLQLQYDALQRCGADAVVAGGAYAIDAESTVLGVMATSNRPWGPDIINPTVAASREWFVENPYNEDTAFLRAQDFELWVRTRHVRQTIYIGAPLIYYRRGIYTDLERYMASSFAMMRVYTMYSRGRRWRLVSQVTAQLVKLWLLNYSFSFNPASWRLNLSAIQLGAGELRSATLVLTQIGNTRIPAAAGSN
jgi:hypothetical protein